LDISSREIKRSFIAVIFIPPLLLQRNKGITDW